VIVGGSPTASHFFLLRQRKSNQKEGDPGFPPFGCPALLDWSGGCGTRATRSDSPRRNPLTSLRYSAAYRGITDEIKITCGGQHVAHHTKKGRWLKQFYFGTSESMRFGLIYGLLAQRY
jgi:hypothetical protein